MTSISSCGAAWGVSTTTTITSDLGTFIARHNRWAELEAREILATSSAARPPHTTVTAQLTGTAIERRRFLRTRVYQRFPLFLRPFLFWFYGYVLRLGFLDGIEGLVFHTLQRFWFRFLIDAKIWELRRPRSQMLESPPSHASQLRVSDSERQRRPGSPAPLAAPPPHGAAARPADPECDYS